MSVEYDLLSRSGDPDTYWPEFPTTIHWVTPEPEVRESIPMLRSRSVRRVLDFGCTLGRHALFFAMHGYEVSACDSNPANLAFTEQAARRQGVSINLWKLTIEAIDQHRCRYDYVLGWQLFDSTGPHDLSGSLSKLGGLLRPGGMAQLSLPEQPTRMPFHIAANTNNPNRTNTKQQSVTYTRLNALTLTGSLVDAGLETIDLHLKRGPQTPQPYWHIIAEKPF